MKKILLSVLLIVGCEEPAIEGCTTTNACNYDADADKDDGSCSYPLDNYDCDDNCIVDVDCLEVCGGDNVADNCGTCDSDSTNDCVQDNCGLWGVNNSPKIGRAHV